MKQLRVRMAVFHRQFACWKGGYHGSVEVFVTLKTLKDSLSPERDGPKHLVTLPQTNSKFAPENRPFGPQKEAGSSSNHPFSGANCQF